MTIDIEDIKKVNLNKDDILVFQIDNQLFFTPSKSQRELLTSFIKYLKDNISNKVIIIPNSMRMGVLSQKDLDVLQNNFKEIFSAPENFNLEKKNE